MNNTLRYQISYRRNLPHIQPPGAIFFITFRLANSLPAVTLAQLRTQYEDALKRISDREDGKEHAQAEYRLQRQHFGRWDSHLDRAASGPTWLKQPSIARLVVDSLHHRDGDVYRLDAYCVMPNHIHLVIQPHQQEDGAYPALSRIMHSLKGYTARKANELLGRRGPFWQAESYDHFIRDDDEWRRIVRYTVINPAKAGLVDDWRDWPWTYQAGRSVP